MSAAVGLTASAGIPVRARTDPFVKPAEIRAYYDRYPERFRTAQMARVRVLSIRADPRNENKDAALEAARARAAAALARLRNGEDWTPVFRDVQRESPEPDPTDGLMELAERGRATPWIEEYAFDHPRGTLSDVVKAGSVFYVLRAEGVRPERIIPFEEAQPLIERELRKARFDAAYYEVCLSLLEESSIRPTELHGKVRTHLREARRKILEEVGL
jgi:parvulin-like peptidyl-prolyl isomerase